MKFSEIVKDNSRSMLHFKSAYASLLGIILVVTLCLTMGIIYVILQWIYYEKIVDAIFIGMLFGATLILMLGIRELHKYLTLKGFDFYSFVLSAQDPQKAIIEHQNLCKSVFNNYKMTISGIIYGLCVGSVPFLLEVWKNNFTLKIMLSLFLYLVNFATGIAFYGLITFFYRAIRMGALVKVDLWHSVNPSTSFLLGATRKISVLASLYISICISSILFSTLPFSGLVICYSVFSAIIILASLLITTYPVAMKLNEAKNKVLGEIDLKLNSEFNQAINSINLSGKSIDFHRFESILELRKKVESIQTWPFKIKVITAGASVIFFSSIPVILQIILGKIFK